MCLLAQAARGAVLVFLQDDKLPPAPGAAGPTCGYGWGAGTHEHLTREYQFNRKLPRTY